MMVRPEAQSDLEEAYAHYEEHKPGLGLEFLLSIEGVLEHIVQFPEMYAVVQNRVRRALSRRFPYSIYYRIEKHDIIVLAVVHSKRHPKTWQSRLR